MFQPFVIICALGMEPSIDNCFAQIQPSFYATEEECQLEIYKFVLSQQDLWKDKVQIANLGCTNYLPSKKPNI